MPRTEIEDWQPSATLETLRLRARLLARIRRFFAERDVLEVETPLLGSATATDLHIHSLWTRCNVPGMGSLRRFYLQTSPEFAMKRLLAAGSGAIFQICKAFRDGEAGPLHNPEFTLLEWYRDGWDHGALMDEVDALLRELLGLEAGVRITYAEAFQQTVGLDPFRAPRQALRGYAITLGLAQNTAASLDRDACLDVILARGVQPRLPRGAVYLLDDPASQASLARVRPGDPAVAERFELFVNGIELANGYHELGDGDEQQRRFLSDIERRKRLGLHIPSVDERLLRALEEGLPDCAGVALGVDRLVMLAAGLDSVGPSMAFPIDRS